MTKIYDIVSIVDSIETNLTKVSMLPTLLMLLTDLRTMVGIKLLMLLIILKGVMSHNVAVELRRPFDA